MSLMKDFSRFCKKCFNVAKKINLERFCQDTSLVGFKYLDSTHKPWFRKLWAMVLAIFIILTFSQVVNRIMFYIFNPFVYSVEENQMSSAVMPPIIICNTMQHRISFAEINPNFTGDLHSFNESSTEFIEFLSMIEDKNKVLNTTVLALLTDLPTISQELNDLAVSSKLSRNIQNGPSEDPGLAAKIDQISDRIHGILPVTYSLLNHDDISDDNPYPLKNPPPLGTHPEAQQLSWVNIINLHKFMLNLANNTCYNDWGCRLKKASQILRQIFNMNLQHFHQISHQSAKEFIVSCFLKGRKDVCSITEFKTDSGQCFRMSVPGSLVTGEADLANTLQIVLDVAKYEKLPSAQNPAGILYLQSPDFNIDKDQFQLTQPYRLAPGRLWDIAIYGIERLERHRIKCGEKRLKFFKSYSDEACMWEERSLAAIKKCGCIPMHNAAGRKHGTINIPSLTNCSFLEEYNCHKMLGDAPIDISDECPKNCSVSKFSVDVTSASLKQEHFYEHLPADWQTRQNVNLDRYAKSSTLIQAHHFFYRTLLQQFSYDLFTEFLPIIQWSDRLHRRCFSENVLVEEIGPSPYHFNVTRDLAGLDIHALNELNQNTLDLSFDARDFKLIQFLDKEFWHTCHKLMALFFHNVGHQPKKAVYTGAKGKLYGLLGNVLSETDFATYLRSNGIFRIKELWQDIARFSRMNKSISINQELNLSLLKAVVPLLDYLGDLLGLPGIDRLFPFRQRFQNLTQDMYMIKTTISKTMDCGEELLNIIFNVQRTNFAQPNWYSELMLLTEELQSFLGGTHYNRVNLAMVQIYYRDIRQAKIEQSLSYTGWGLLADIGGTLGLYLGATVITLLETVLLLFKNAIMVKPLSNPAATTTPTTQLQGGQSSDGLDEVRNRRKARRKLRQQQAYPQLQNSSGTP